MLELNDEARKRVAARIASRERGGRWHPKLHDQIANLASAGWAPSIIAQVHGRSEQWAIEQITEAAR